MQPFSDSPIRTLRPPAWVPEKKETESMSDEELRDVAQLLHWQSIPGRAAMEGLYTLCDLLIRRGALNREDLAAVTRSMRAAVRGDDILATQLRQQIIGRDALLMQSFAAAGTTPDAAPTAAA